MIRPYGLTVNDQGLYLRVEAIEAFDRKRSLVFLTSKPDLVLKCLHLDPEQYWEQFQTVLEMFEYAASCRFFHVKETDRTEDVKTLKSNDRKRMRHRGIFKMWIEEFLPACRENGPHAEKQMSREEVRDDAFATFGVREEYEHRQQSFLLEKDKEGVVKWVKSAVPSEGVETSIRSAAIRGMRAIFEHGDYQGTYTKEPVIFRDEGGFFVEEWVVEFVRQHWAEVGKATLAKENVRMAEQMQKKALERTRKETVKEPL